MPSPGAPSSSTQTTQVRLPAWLEDYSQNTLNLAGQIADRPYTPFTGQTVAGFSGDQTQAQQSVRDMQGATAGFMGGLAQGAASLANYRPTAVAAGTLPGTDMTQYMNPYINNVERFALDSIENQRRNAENALADRAIASRAFGGSRLALQQAMNDQNAMETAARTSANLRAQAFGNAQQMATQDLGRTFQADTFNQNLGLQGQQAALQALGQAGNLAGAGQRAAYTDISALSASGAEQQALEQAALADQQARFNEAQNFPLQQLQTRLLPLGGQIPYGQTQTVTAPLSRGNPAMGALGGAASGAMMGSMFPGIGTGIGAAAGGLIGLLGSR